jgi:predicted Zn-ribbon and HTH transcriptional regulator
LPSNKTLFIDLWAIGTSLERRVREKSLPQSSRKGYPLRKEKDLSRLKGAGPGKEVPRARPLRRHPLTIRQQIAELLKGAEYTAREISKILRVREREVYDHLPHVEKSLGPRVSIVSQPARCLNCGFVFKKRTRLTTPGRCPVCRSEHISDPVYKLPEKR